MVTVAMSAMEVIRELTLTKLPEGGYFRRTYAKENPGEKRGHISMIYYLLEQSKATAWHRIDVDQIFIFNSGASFTLRMAADLSGNIIDTVVGPDLTNGQRPQVLVPGGMWQKIIGSDENWSLMTCVVTPEFLFETFEMHTEE